MLQINFESEGFPVPGPVPNGFGTLQFTWDDLLWAAITVGRPNRYYVFRHGLSSLYEAIFRISAVRMTLEQAIPGWNWLSRTGTARSLDPSEKGAVSYFIGMTLCKLFTEIQLNAPLLLHYDVFERWLRAKLLPGRSRPDFVGCTQSGEWVGVESKGRVHELTRDEKKSAKEQASRIISVGGDPVKSHICTLSYFKNEVLQFFWRDPVPSDEGAGEPIHIEATESEMWQAYYEPLLALVEGGGMAITPGGKFAGPLHDEDVEIKVVPEVRKLLHLEKWLEAGHWCHEHHDRQKELKAHGDGLRVIAGESWSKRFEETFEQR